MCLFSHKSIPVSPLLLCRLFEVLADPGPVHSQCFFGAIASLSRSRMKLRSQADIITGARFQSVQRQGSHYSYLLTLLRSTRLRVDQNYFIPQCPQCMLPSSFFHPPFPFPISELCIQLAPCLAEQKLLAPLSLSSVRRAVPLSQDESG